MLEHPERYEWAAVEADEYGYLDDVVAARRDGTMELRQVKFAAHPDEPDDAYGWEDLLATRTGKNGKELPSLIRKWGTTVLELLSQCHQIEAALVTNRQAAPDLAACLDKQTHKVRLDCLPGQVLDGLIRQLGDSERVGRFLDIFQFQMDQPNLETWEDGIRKRFSLLHGDHTGWLNLKDKVRLWTREKQLPGPEGKIRLDDIREAALWHQLHSLPQRFPVPPDYVLPSKDLHRDVKERLSSTAGQGVVLCGTPGIGKSTYLSYLYQELRSAKVSVVRHHYFLSLTDTTVGRFDHVKVIESLMAELRQCAHTALRDVTRDNPSAKDFGSWLDRCSQHFCSQDHPLVIIIDGLDHVWRDQRDISELRKLFEYLLPCRPGISLAIGTQSLPDEHMPQRLLNAVPREQWITIGALDRQAVFEWTQKNESRLSFRRNVRPEDPKDELREIAGAFFDMSQGQPLLLCFSLHGLLEARSPINAQTIAGQAHFKGASINDYYRSLWTALREEGRFVLIMIISSGFEWSESGISQCCRRGGLDAVKAQSGWKQVAHLMCRTPLGWRPFHGSLGVFVRESDDYRTLVSDVRREVAEWLAEDAPDHLRWAYTWTAQADQGDSSPLLQGTNREWLIDSLATGYPHHRACELLKIATRKALEDGDLHGFACKGLLNDYASNDYNFNDTSSRDTWTYVHLKCGPIKYLPQVLLSQRANLSEGQLGNLAEALAAEGDQDAVSLIRDELVDRFNTRQMTSRSNDWVSDVAPIIWTEALIDDLAPAVIANRIELNREGTASVRLAHAYAKALRAHRRLDVLRSLGTADLLEQERDQFLSQGFLLALEEGSDWSDVACSYSGHLFARIYARVKDVPDFCASTISLPEAGVLASRQYILSEEHRPLKHWFEDCFYKILSCHLWKQHTQVEEWLEEIGSHSWVRCFVQSLAVAARDLATRLCAGEGYSIADLLARP